MHHNPKNASHLTPANTLARVDWGHIWGHILKIKIQNQAFMRVSGHDMNDTLVYLH